jgi:hypothetical protein
MAMAAQLLLTIASQLLRNCFAIASQSPRYCIAVASLSLRYRYFRRFQEHANFEYSNNDCVTIS